MEDLECGATLAEQECDAADARLHAALDHAALEHAIAAPLPEDDAASSEDDGYSSADGGAPHLCAALLQHMAAASLSLHAQAVAVQNIRHLVPLQLDAASTFYAHWRDVFLLDVGRYSLESHVHSDVAIPTSPD